MRWAICAGASDHAVPSPELVQLQLRYVTGEIDQVQVHDELMRWYRPDIAPATDVRPLLPEQPGRVYPYKEEMAALMVERGSYSKRAVLHAKPFIKKGSPKTCLKRAIPSNQAGMPGLSKRKSFLISLGFAISNNHLINWLTA